MAQVNLTEQALDDLDAICLFIARDSVHYAKLFAEKAFAATDRLKDFPLLGRVVPEFGREDLREVILGNYRIIYRVHGEEIDVLTIHHGARPLRSEPGV